MAATQTAEVATTPREPQEAGLPTLHHLNNSQSQRILWLFEELGIEYNLVLYRRVNDRAPPELAKIHPLGRSPTLVTADGKTVIESSAIVSYLLQTYDTSGRFRTSDSLREETLVSFAGASLGPLTATELIFELLSKRSPWPISLLMKQVHNTVKKQYSAEAFEKNMRYLENELGDRDWFNGDNMGKSDVMLSWPLDNIAQRGWVDFEKWPRVKKWRERLEGRDAWKKALEKGNGYVLRF